MDGFCEYLDRETMFMCANAGEVRTWLAGIAVLGLVAWLLRARLGSALLVVWTLRAPILTLLVGAGILMIPAQGRELALGLPDATGRWWLPPAVLAWAIQAWLWSRMTLYSAYGSDRDQWPNRRLIEWLPRILAGLVHLLALAAIIAAFMQLAAWPGSEDARWALLEIGLAIAGLGVIMQVLLARRLQLLGRLHDAKPEFDGVLLPRRMVAPNSSLVTVCAGQAPLGLAILAGALISGTCLIWWFGRRPVEAGQMLGTAPILFLALGIWTAVGSVLVIMSRHLRVPLLLCAILLGFGMNLARTAPDSRVTSMESNQPHRLAVADRPSVIEALKQWHEQEPAAAGADRKVPLVIVAAEGGGLRAAYWTASALGRMTRDLPMSSHALFAISGVSGGSVGALVDVGLRAAHLAKTGQVANLAFNRDLIAKSQQEAVDFLLGNDFLAAPTAALLTSDTLGSVFPGFLKFGGRGTALENAWSIAWPAPDDADLPDGNKGWWNPIGGPFLDLWRKDIPGWRPQLLLNSTHQETGRRVIQSSMRIESAVFHDAWDFHALTGCDIWANTAAHNSARFSYVSPAGILRAPYAEPEPGRPILSPAPTGGCLNDGASLQSLGHLLDGGYFENYGAVTALELAEAVAAALPDRYRIIVLLLSNDVGAAARDHVTRATACPQGGGYLDFIPASDRPAWYEAAWNEVTAPVTGVLSSRVARSALAARMLGRWASCPEQGRPGPQRSFIHIAMCDPQLEAPLGWVMGESSRQNIRGQITAKCNEEEWTRLTEAMTVSPAEEPSDDLLAGPELEVIPVVAPAAGP